jgi:hypothetical protein
VAERRGVDRSSGVELGPLLHRWLTTTRGRFELFALAALIALVVAIAGHIYGRVLAARDVLSRDNAIEIVRTDNQKLEAQVAEQEARLSAMQSRLNRAEAALEAIVPSKNTYVINSNQSLIVADGRLTIGMIGSPANEGININVNGQQRTVAAGDIIKLSPDGTTNCQVVLQSFNMFKALVTASCAAAKP